jgi:hypothetical protein
MLLVVVVVVPEAARESRFIRSPPAVPAVVRAPGVAAEDATVLVSRTSVRSRPRNSAKRIRRTRTATARIPNTPPGKLVVVVV